MAPRPSSRPAPATSSPASPSAASRVPRRARWRRWRPSMPELVGSNLTAGFAPADAALPVAPVVPRRAGAEIAGLGIALPEQIETNAPIAARLGIDVEWIVKRTGIEERRIAAPGELLFELGAAAAERALLAAGVSPGQIDLVIVATTSNDELMPGASPRVAAAIGAA